MAVVNKGIVTRKEVMDRAEPALRALAEQRLPAADFAKYQESILNDLRRRVVEERLLAAEGERLAGANEAFKKRVEERVQARIEEESRKAGGEAALRERVKVQGSTWKEYQDRMTAEMMRDVVIYQFVTRDLTVGPDEIQEYFDRRRARFVKPERATYRQIFFRFGKLEERKATHDRALGVLAELRKGGDFAAAARKHSDDPRDEVSGLWDSARGERPKPIDDAIFSAPIGEPTEPVVLERGFAIVRVESRQAAEAVSFDSVQQKIESALLAEKRQARYDALIERLWRQGYVELIK
jgi:parvulin-like peptidyl-prolyl isomerase